MSYSVDPLWLIQSTGIISSAPHSNVEYLNKLELEFKDFGLLPFTNEITNLENILQDPTQQYIIRGGTKLLTILDKVKSISELSPHLSQDQIHLGDIYMNNLRKGLFYDVNKFDQLYYKDLDLPLLNRKAWYLPVMSNLDTKFDRDMFIKPSRDLKAFNGGIIEAGTSIEEYIKGQQYQAHYVDEVCIVSELVNIYAEYRFFIVNKKVSAYSQYRRGGQMNVTGHVDQSIIDVAKEYALYYQPHDIFVMDLCETPHGVKIVEYNCWNASGLYHCDGVKMFNDVNEYVKSI